MVRLNGRKIWIWLVLLGWEPFVLGASIQVQAIAAMEGSYGLEVLMNGTSASAFVLDESPNGEGVFRVEFLLDINDLVFGSNNGPGSNHAILKFWDMDQAGPYPRQFLIIGLRLGLDGKRKLFAKISEPDGALVFRNAFGTPMEFNLPDQASDYPVRIRVEYAGASSAGASDGLVRISRKTRYAASFTGREHNQLPSYPLNVDTVTFGGAGAMDAGSTGSYYLDGFRSFKSLAP